MIDKRPNGAGDLAMQMKRNQAALVTLANQREEALNKAAEARIEAILLADENDALRARIERLEKASVHREENIKDERQQVLPLVDGARAPHIN